MKNNCEIADPGRVFYYCDNKGGEWLGIDTRDCKLEMCNILWVRTYYPQRGGDRIRQPPPNFTEKNSLRLPVELAFERLQQGVDAPQISGNDPDTVWFGLDIHDIDQSALKALDTICFLLIPCVALEEKKIPGFKGGCIA